MTAPADPAPVPARDERVICEHADRCGGCPIIGLPYSDQLALKRGRVVQSVARYAALELVYTEPVLPAQPLVGYRTRAKLIVGQGAKLGLFAKGGGHQVVDIPECRVLAPVLARVAAILRARIADAESNRGPLAPHDASGRGSLRAVDLREVREGEGAGVLVTLVVQRGTLPSLALLEESAKDLMHAVPEVLGVAVNFHDGDAPQILGSETQRLAGVASAPDRVGVSMHLATFGSFVQSHRGQAGRVHAALAEAIGVARARAEGRKPRVLDLYGGSGAIALGLAAAGASVRLVESFAPAVAQARAAAQAQGLDVEAECADVAGALRGLVESCSRFDAVTVNPPRRGMSPVAREWLARLEPPLVAYVSCDPETLARDLDHLSRLGYATATLRPLDMIPLTDEVETIAVLRRSGLPLPRVAHDGPELLVVEKGPHEPTVPQGEYGGSLLARVRRIPGAENAVPAQRLDVGTSGLVVFARRADLAPKWGRALAAATTRAIYVVAVRGVTPSKGAITRDLREDGKLHAARTRYRRLAVAAGHSVLRVVPEMGHNHQIRRHFAAIGHPVLGDDRYGHAMTNRYFEEKNGLDRAFLHCVRLELDHPDTGARLIVEAALPGDLRAVLERTAGPGTLRFLEHKNALGTSGTSHLPPGPDDGSEDRGSALDVDARSPTLRPELIEDDDDGG
ncbi:MAG TPA: pseudouridine synthase, partial [Polyangiaceae bacterium]|nr:pseudouridine synthase [Polyangiaceae bacterium]